MPPFSLPFVFLFVSMPTLSVGTPKLDRISPWDGSAVVVTPLVMKADPRDPWTGAASAHVTLVPLVLERGNPFEARENDL